MTIFKGSILHTYGTAANGRRWRNNYWINAVGPEAGLLKLEVIASAEIAFHSTGVRFLEATLSDPSHAFNGRKTGLNTNGERVISGDAIPDWNVVVVDYLDLDFSRPERKYYRVEIGEGDIAGSFLGNTLMDLVQGVQDTLIAGSSAPCTPTGGTITTAVVQGRLGMRQTSWHRRSRPGFRRGWVPA